MITIITSPEEFKKAAKLACEIPETKVRLIVEGTTAHRTYEGHIFRKIQKECYLEDIRNRVEENYEAESRMLRGMTAEDVVNDTDLLEDIFRRFDKGNGCGDEYWCLIDNCISSAIKERAEGGAPDEP